MLCQFSVNKHIRLLLQGHYVNKNIANVNLLTCNNFRLKIVVFKKDD